MYTCPVVFHSFSFRILRCHFIGCFFIKVYMKVLTRFRISILVYHVSHTQKSTDLTFELKRRVFVCNNMLVAFYTFDRCLRYPCYSYPCVYICLCSPLPIQNAS